VLVGFQRSMLSISHAVRFTVNLKVVSRQTWALARADRTWLPKAPSASHPPPGRGMVGAHRRPHGQPAGPLVVVQPGQPLESLAAEVIEALTRYGLPVFRGAARQAGSGHC
jgi:hypothetical protein